MSAMRVYVSTVPDELTTSREVACDVARELGFVPVVRATHGLRSFKPVTACARQVASVDMVLVLVGHRRGDVPSPRSGGDGFHPWSWWEAHAAFDRGLPVAVLMAADGWRRELREDDAGGRAVMRDFRGELGRLAKYFDDESGGGFRQQVRAALVGSAPHSAAEAGPAADWISDSMGHLRRWPAPGLPRQPYPVLLPYTHPDLMAGRDRELEEVGRLLTRPMPILGLHAPSGTGKSSFLSGGLMPRLRAAGRAVTLDRHPCEPGIVRRLLGDLFDEGKPAALDDTEARAFVDRMLVLEGLTDEPPVLILDQFEDLLRHDSQRRARAVVGTLLAASVQRLPGRADASCRWILAYRQEFHGEVFQWLSDVLRDTVPLGGVRGDSAVATEALPHDLSSPYRFHTWALSLLGTPAPGTAERVEAAARVFQAAIEKPLEYRAAGSTEGPLYPWRFAGDGAARLAHAFGEAREARRSAPLAPELQVVLAHLLDASYKADDDGVKLIEVPEDPGQLIDRALEEHLRRSLDAAFPGGMKAAARLGRTRALLALRELADTHGQRDEGRPVSALARAIGYNGHEVLEKLATPQARLVLREARDRQVYVLSHDRLAEVIVRLVDEEGASTGFGVDPELLGLRRFVSLQRELFVAGEVEQSTEVAGGQFKKIEQNADALLWDEEERRWWAACGDRRRRDRRRRAIRGAVAATVVLGLVVFVWIQTLRDSEDQELLAQVASGESEAAFAALGRLSEDSAGDTERRLKQVRSRESPFDVFEKGLGGVGEEDRGAVLLRVVELLLPLIREAPEDPVRIASTAWALDFFAIRDPALRDRATALREDVLRPLRQRRPPPGPPPWADIPAGTFQMGIEPGKERDEDRFEEWPRHRVTLSGFRLMTHEVTNAEYRRLVPGYHPRDAPDVPVMNLSWYQAYTYAAWLGGRLPTEAEWEYAARAACVHAYCKRDGREASLTEVAWVPGNSVDESTGEPSLRPVGRLEPNPWGLHDVYGNVAEWNTDWFDPYSEENRVDPPGPPGPSLPGDYRAIRGGSFMVSVEKATAWSREGFPAQGSGLWIGIRVAADLP